MKTSLILIFGLLLGAIQANASDYVSQCSKFPAPLKGGYCVHVPQKNQSPDIVYHLHGLGGSEENWQSPWNYTEQIRREWDRTSAKLPTVVSVSFGPLWILAQKNASPVSGLFDVFVGKILPSIEKGLGGLKGRRILFGESMGGVNSTQLAFKTDLFSRVAILCAPMSEISPFAPASDIEAHAKTSGAYNRYIMKTPNPVVEKLSQASELARGFFRTPEDWAKANPLTLAATKLEKYPELYISAGFYDEYALYEATEKFVSSLKENGANPEWRPLWGGHCAFDIESLSKFMVK